jgi:hypothetical protein
VAMQRPCRSEQHSINGQLDGRSGALARQSARTDRRR